MTNTPNDSQTPMQDESYIHAASQEVIASLEGARILISNGICRLDEYDFRANCWNLQLQHTWPLSRELAHEWLRGWNRVDRFKAFNILVRPEPD